MIDKLDLRVPAQAHFTREFGYLYKEVRGDAQVDPFRADRHYVMAGDLREFGYEAILRLGCQHGKKADHKLELMDTGGRTFAGMVTEIEKIFDIDARYLELMRLDLAADVPAVPVTWFNDRVRVRYKQWMARVGDIHQAEPGSDMGMRNINTLYYGKRPNCFRIYDKIAEWWYQYQRLLRKVSQDAEHPTFEATFGVSRDQVMTRVERQIHGSQLPEHLARVSRLRNLAQFNPFEKLEILTGKPEPNPDDYDLSTFALGMFIRQRAEEWGMPRVRAYLNQKSPGNAARILARYAEFLPADEGPGVSSARLCELYQQSVSRQLAN